MMKTLRVRRIDGTEMSEISVNKAIANIMQGIDRDRQMWLGTPQKFRDHALGVMRSFFVSLGTSGDDHVLFITTEDKDIGPPKTTTDQGETT